MKIISLEPVGLDVGFNVVGAAVGLTVGPFDVRDSARVRASSVAWEDLPVSNSIILCTAGPSVLVLLPFTTLS